MTTMTLQRLQMRGPRQVRHLIVDHLQTNLPAHLEILRREWELSKTELPDPLRYCAHEPQAVADVAPVVYVFTGRQLTRPIEAREEGFYEYEVTYPVQVFGWVTAEGRDAVQDRRDDFGTALKTFFLAHQTLGRSLQDMLVLESTVVEDFSDIVPVKGERFVGGVYIGFDVRVTESLGQSFDELGVTVDRVRVDVVKVPVDQPMPEHPALAEEDEVVP